MNSEQVERSPDVCLVYPEFTLNGNPPLGLAYIAAVLERNNIEVKIIDPTFGLTFEGVISKIIGDKPILVGIYASTLFYNDALKIAKAIKSRSNIPICLGGPHPTIFPDDVISNSEVDFVVVGEGEYTFLELVETVLSNGNLKSVAGIVFKEGETILTNPARHHIDDLDSLPYPARHLLDYDAYIGYRYLYHGVPATTIIASRGCPFSCTYCQPTLRRIFGRKVRWRSPSDIVDEIEHLIEKYGIKLVIFHDDTFTVKKEWAMAMCDEIIDRGVGIKWICNARANTVGEELIKNMKKAGCVEIRVGVESGSQWVLDNIYNKKITVDQVKNVFRLIKKYNIQCWAFFMVGTPGETREMVNDSMKLAREIKPDHANVSITIPLPGTKLWDIAETYGSFDKEWSKYDYSGNHAIIETGLLSKEEVEEFASEFREEFMRGKKRGFKVLVGLRVFRLLSWSFRRSIVTRRPDHVRSVVNFLYGLRLKKL